MVTGLTGRTGVTALSLAAAECRIDQELVPIPRRRLVESRVLERVTKPERATKILAQLMVIGLIGRTGATVPSRVVVECKIGLEPVPIPHRPLVESRVLERVTRPERATKILAQSTETGLTGMTGVTVLSRVVAECKKDQGPVPILRRRLVESHALGRARNRERAMKTLAQLMVTGLSGKTGATVLSRVAAECKIGQGLVPTPHRHLAESHVRVMLTKHVHVTNSLAQEMAAGRIGSHGATALSHVEEEYRKDRGLVPILHRHLVARRVQGKVRKQDPATKIPAQLTATGPTGRTGATALSRVGEECRKEQELVPIPHRPLEASRVLERVKNQGNAMKTLAQSTETGQTGVRGAHVQSHVVGELSSILAVVITPLPRMEDLFVSEKARNQGLATLTTVEYQL